MRAVRARRAALLKWLAGLLGLPAVLLVVFEVLVPAEAGFFFVLCAGFAVGFFAAEEAEPAGAAVDPPFAVPLVDCGPTGRAIINQGSKPAMQRKASREAGVKAFMNLISSL